MQGGHRTPSCDCWCVGAPSQKVPHRGGVVLQRVLCCRRNLDKAELPIEVQGIDTHPLQTRRMPSMALTLETLWHCAALASSSCHSLHSPPAAHLQSLRGSGGGIAAVWPMSGRRLALPNPMRHWHMHACTRVGIRLPSARNKALVLTKRYATPAHGTAGDAAASCRGPGDDAPHS